MRLQCLCSEMQDQREGIKLGAHQQVSIPVSSAYGSLIVLRRWPLHDACRQRRSLRSRHVGLRPEPCRPVVSVLCSSHCATLAGNFPHRLNIGHQESVRCSAAADARVSRASRRTASSFVGDAGGQLRIAYTLAAGVPVDRGSAAVSAAEASAGPAALIASPLQTRQVQLGVHPITTAQSKNCTAFLEPRLETQIRQCETFSPEPKKGCLQM